MKKFLKEHKTTIIIVLSILISITTAQINSFFVNCNNINNTLFRLHILANSNSEYDQALKLLVRDKILELDSTIFSTQNLTNQNLDLIKTTAQNVLQENNCDLPVNVELTNMYFNTRFYDNYTIPAGNYEALRVTIGDAVGENWWCVLYPPLCLPAVNNDGELYEVMTDTLTNEQVEIIENGDKYEFKFALFELFTSLSSK